MPPELDLPVHLRPTLTASGHARIRWNAAGNPWQPLATDLLSFVATRPMP
jgi:hypothetical protein